MGMDRSMAWILLGLLVASEARPAAEPRQATSVAEQPERVRVILSGRSHAKLRWRVSAALSLAARRLREKHRCRALFTALGTEGHRTLAAMTFYLADADREKRVCHERRAVAFTRVGSSRTGLCPERFVKLPLQEAGAILIHEALHQAGLEEWPHDPDAPTSVEITQLVRQRCDL